MTCLPPSARIRLLRAIRFLVLLITRHKERNSWNLPRAALEFSALGVTEIARTVCELLEWKRPSGGLKNHECRQLLERLQAEGFLQLPNLRKVGGRATAGF